jgi:hypothetical protein
MKSKLPYLAATLALLLTVEARAQSPSNDGFSNAWALNGEIGSSTGNSTHATYEAGEPYEVEESLGRTLWWSWTATNAGRYVFHTTGSNFDTILAIYTGNALDNLTLVDYNDQAMGTSQSRVTFDAVAGQTYHVQVDGWGDGGFGKVSLYWLPFPTMIYTWRNVWTTQGAELDTDDNSIYWAPRTTSTFNGLVIRGRSTDTSVPYFGEEQGPIAFFYFSPVKVGKRTVTYFQYTTTYPQLDNTDPNAPYYKGGFTSLMSQYTNRNPIKANETAYLDELDNTGEYTFYTSVSGAATRKLPFPGAPKTWYASTLTGTTQNYNLLNTGDLPVQGEPEFGYYQKSTDTLKFSAADTNRVKGLGFDAAVAAMRQHLISKGFVEGVAP